MFATLYNSFFLSGLASIAALSIRFFPTLADSFHPRWRLQKRDSSVVSRRLDWRASSSRLFLVISSPPALSEGNFCSWLRFSSKNCLRMR